MKFQRFWVLRCVCVYFFSVLAVMLLGTAAWHLAYFVFNQNDRFEMGQYQIACAKKIASRSNNPEVKNLINYFGPKLIVGQPFIGGVIGTAKNESVFVVPLLHSDSVVSTFWLDAVRYMETGVTAATAKTEETVPKNLIFTFGVNKYAEVWSGLIMLHELKHLKQENDPVPQTRTQKELAVRKFVIGICGELGGCEYANLVEAEMRRIREVWDSRSDLLPRREIVYNTGLDQVWGAAGSEAEKEERMMYFWLDVVFRVIEQSFPVGEIDGIQGELLESHVLI